MATSRSYFTGANYRFLSSERDVPMMSPDSAFEFDESDLWNSAVSQSPEFRKSVQSSKFSKKQRHTRSRRSRSVASTAASLPVNVPDWSKILKDEYREYGRRDSDNDDFNDEDSDNLENRIPPHEFLAKQLERTRIASFSVHEGVGRTLKGRDLSRVRNAIWEKTGFQD